jgi:hypothetical protein
MSCLAQPKNGLKDSTVVSNKALRNLVIAAQQSDLLRQELRISDSIIFEKGRELALTAARDSFKIVALTYEIEQHKQVRTAQQGAIDQLYKTIRKQKRRTFFVGAIGILTTAAAFYIGVK